MTQKTETAVISPCQKHRYSLHREVKAEGLTFMYIGINPSTADWVTNDATIRKMMGFTERNGGGRFFVGNVFSYRSKDVRQLGRLSSTPRGVEYWIHMQKMLHQSDVIVPCWGDRAKIPQHLRTYLDEIMQWLYRELKHGQSVMTFGMTKNGDPKHPLMLGYDTPLVALTEGKWETLRWQHG